MILQYRPVTIIFNNRIFVERILPEQIKPLDGFETPLVIQIPRILLWKEGDHEETVQLAGGKYPQGTLTLYTSSEPLSRNSRLSDLNCVDIIGEIGVIASYRISELGYVRRLSTAESIYGHCKCLILEDPNNDYVSNDRSKLVEGSTTFALRKWISEQIDDLSKYAKVFSHVSWS